MGDLLYGMLPYPTERLIFAIVALGVAVAAVLGRTGTRDLLGLTLIVTLGVGLRMLFSQDTLMDMSNYWREPAIIPWLRGQGIPLYALFSDGMDRFEVFSYLNLALSCALPLLVFCLADVMFGQRNVSLAAAFLTAICPVQIHFAASESMYISSNFVTTGTFLLLHSAFAARRWVAEIFYGLGSFQLFEVAVAAREANFLFGAVAVVAAVWMIAGGMRRAWSKTLWSLLLLDVSIEFFLHRMSRMTGAGNAEGPRSFVQLLDFAWNTVAHHSMTASLVGNNYLVPSLYPLGITVVALVGVTWLAFNGRRHLFYLFSFFAIFYVGHAAVMAWDQLAISRYGLQSIIPIVFAAAFGIDLLLRLRRRYMPVATPWRLAAEVVAVVLFFASFVPALTIHRSPPSDIQEEYAFMRELRTSNLPERGSLVIEPDVEDAGGFLAGICKGPRFAYFGQRVRNGELVEEVAWTRSSAPVHDGPVYLYVGLPCFFMRPPEEPIAGACAEALRAADWELVASKPIHGLRHDTSNGFAAIGHTIGLYRSRS